MAVRANRPPDPFNDWGEYYAAPKHVREGYENRTRMPIESDRQQILPDRSCNENKGVDISGNKVKTKPITEVTKVHLLDGVGCAARHLHNRKIDAEQALREWGDSSCSEHTLYHTCLETTKYDIRVLEAAFNIKIDDEGNVTYR